MVLQWKVLAHSTDIPKHHHQEFTFVVWCRHKCHLKFSWTIPITHLVEAKSGVVSGFSHTVDMNPNVEMNENSETGTWKEFPTVCPLCCDCSLEAVIVAACERKLFPGLNIPSRDVTEVRAASTEHCHALCTAHPKCTFFSFDRWANCALSDQDWFHWAS